MSKHTPGPWEWYWRQTNGEAECGVHWMKSEGHAYSVCRAPRFQTKDQWEADARLIAASPDLLSAICWVRDAESLRREHGEPGLSDELLAAIDAAIAKATGETE